MRVHWISDWELGEPVVWVDVARFDAAWRKDETCYIGPRFVPPGNGHRDRYDRFGEWLLEWPKRPVGMPVVSLIEGDVVAFTNGRHRFAWLRDHGATAVPIETDDDCIPALLRLMGTDERQTVIQVIRTPRP